MKHLVYGLLFTAVAASGCRKQPEEVKPQTAAQTIAPKPAEPEVKLTFAFLPDAQPSAETKKATEEFAKTLGEKSGFAVEAMIPKDYPASIRALKKNKAQVVVLSSWAFLKAHHAADGSLLLADEREGKASFKAQWFVAADSKLEKLTDLKGKKIAFTAPQSAAGFLYPYALLIKEGAVKSGEDLQKTFPELFFSGSEAEALGALVAGEVDAAAASEFAPAAYLKEEDRAKVKALASMDGVPTEVIAVRADMDMKLRDKVKAALLEMNATEGALNIIGAQKLVERSHGDHMTALQEAQELVGTEYLLPEDAPDAPSPKGMDAPKEQPSK